MAIAREHHWDRSVGEAGLAFPDAATVREALRITVRHVTEFLALVAERRAPEADRSASAPEDRFLVQEEGHVIHELLGFRVQGHPCALLGAFRIPKHSRAPGRYGRSALGPFLSSPPRGLAISDVSVPPGLLLVNLPRGSESIPTFVERLRSGDEEPVLIDPQLVELAFDFRFRNPSEVKMLPTQAVVPRRCLVRTTHGHVLSGLSVDLYRTLHREVSHVALADVIQHRVGSKILLPTVALHRSLLTAHAMVEEGAASATSLLFHPSTANQQHVFGKPYDVEAAELSSGGAGGTPPA